MKRKAGMTSRAQSSEDQWKKWRRNSGIRYSCCGFPFLHFLLSVHRLRNIIIISSLNASTTRSERLSLRGGAWGTLTAGYTGLPSPRCPLDAVNGVLPDDVFISSSSGRELWDIRVRASSYHSSSVTPWTQRRGFPAANTQGMRLHVQGKRYATYQPPFIVIYL
ncbi:hypothetical protein O3P69_002370 [Scylla paramamosain]|uniref:Uncharacterized protein n=1 Tax=Scylla paramamosain TaxID=85552 RepID=A0AAW0V6X4_SCYPA